MTLTAVTRPTRRVPSGLSGDEVRLVKLAVSDPGPEMVTVVGFVLGLATVIPPVLLQPLNVSPEGGCAEMDTDS